MVHLRSREGDEIALRMAGLAGQAGRQMGPGFGYRRNAGKHLAVVAVGAAADDAGVIHFTAGESAGRWRGRNRRCMASLAGSRGRQVVHRLGYRCHSDKNLAVMASRTAADDTRAGVVHDARIIRGTMTHRARCRGRQVIGRLGAARCNCKARR